MSHANPTTQEAAALRRRVKREVKAYMKCEVLCLRVFAYNGRDIVLVDYVDFLPQSVVENHIRSLCPDGWIVITNRLWSEETAKQLLFQMLNEEVDRKNHYFLTQNPVLAMRLMNRFQEFSCVKHA